MQSLKLFAIINLVAAVVAGLVYYEVSIWNECRQTNSFLYCVRVVSK